jgi:hypothetical protein
MSWLFSQAAVVEYLRAGCVGGELDAQSKSTCIPEVFFLPVKMKVSFPLFPFGMTSAHLTECHGAELLRWYQGASRVKRFQQLLEAEGQQKIYGRKCSELLEKSNRLLCLQKTSVRPQSKPQRKTSILWVSHAKLSRLERKTWVQTTFGRDIGYLHTPTTKANYCADSMQKWPAARNYKRVFGRPNPEVEEWLMGLPAGWTDIGSQVTDGFQQWQSRHGTSCAKKPPQDTMETGQNIGQQRQYAIPLDIKE